MDAMDTGGINVHELDADDVDRASSLRDMEEDIIIAAAQSTVQQMHAAALAGTAVLESMQAEEEGTSDGDSDMCGSSGEVSDDEARPEKFHEEEKATRRVKPRADHEQSTRVRSCGNTCRAHLK